MCRYHMLNVTGHVGLLGSVSRSIDRKLRVEAELRVPCATKS